MGAVGVIALLVALPVAIPAFASAGALSATFAPGASGASGIRCGVGHVLRFGWRVLSGEVRQPPAFGRGCGLDLPFGSPAFCCRGSSAAQSGTGGTSMDPGMADYRSLDPVWQAFPRIRVRRSPIAVRPSGALLPKSAFGRRRAAGWNRNCLTARLYPPRRGWQGGNGDAPGRLRIWG